jgi:hypothetical protein
MIYHDSVILCFFPHTPTRPLFPRARDPVFALVVESWCSIRYVVVIVVVECSHECVVCIRIREIIIVHVYLYR